MRHFTFFHPVTNLISITGFIAASLFSVSAMASGGPPMITDDPGTPGDGHWEINLATLSSHNTDANTYQVPLIDINYGIGDRLQLKLELPWLIQKETDGTRRSGMGNGLAGVKWRFYDAGENDWQMSVYPQIEFTVAPTKAVNDDLIDSGTSYLLPLEIVRDFGDFDINVEIGRWFRPQQRADSWIAGVAITHEVSKGIELIAELHNETTLHSAQNGGQSERIINVGARWNLSERYTVMLSAGRDWHSTIDAPTTLLTYLGLQLHY